MSCEIVDSWRNFESSAATARVPLCRFSGRPGRRFSFFRALACRSTTTHPFRAPVLMLPLEGDRLISRRASDVLSGKASSARIEALHLDLGEQVDHFRWARRQAQSVAVAIADWLSRT
jgi:predicted alpha/beta hydrolase